MNTQEDRAERKQTTVSLKIPASLYDRFTDAAAADHRSIAGEVRFLIEQCVLDHEAKASEAKAAA
jgi:hypothetical protein